MLDLAESAMLAGLVRAPSQLAPNRNPQAARRRAETVLEAMVAAGYLDTARAAAARAHPAKLAVPPEAEPGQNYFVDTVEAELKRLVGSPPVDLGVDTTLDLHCSGRPNRSVEQVAQAGARAGMSARGRSSRSPPTGLSWRWSAAGTTRRANSTARSRPTAAGFLFKVFVYLAAFNAGYTPDSVIVDRPVTIGDWEPKNFETGYQGR